LILKFHQFYRFCQLLVKNHCLILILLHQILSTKLVLKCIHCAQLAVLIIGLDLFVDFIYGLFN